MMTLAATRNPSSAIIASGGPEASISHRLAMSAPAIEYRATRQSTDIRSSAASPERTKASRIRIAIAASERTSSGRSASQ